MNLQLGWYLREDATATLDQMRLSGREHTILRDLVIDGLAVVRQVNSADLCSRVVRDYEHWQQSRSEYVEENRDAHGREKRLVNFHLASAACRDLILTSDILPVLDLLFGAETGIYTSLTFKYGTQQPVHRDSPHFATWPKGRFAGVWFALEDVNPAAGPLFYYRGAHRMKLDESVFLDQAAARLPEATRAEQLALALDLYNGEVIRQAPLEGDLVVTDVRKGDAVIWHPELPHGGMPAEHPDMTRWSTVFHCAPVDTQVHQHDAFFERARNAEPPPPRYGYRDAGQRKIALAGDVAYM